MILIAFFFYLNFKSFFIVKNEKLFLINCFSIFLFGLLIMGSISAGIVGELGFAFFVIVANGTVQFCSRISYQTGWISYSFYWVEPIYPKYLFYPSISHDQNIFMFYFCSCLFITSLIIDPQASTHCKFDPFVFIY